MGLAPYGEPKYVNLIIDELVDLRDDGSFTVNPEVLPLPYRVENDKCPLGIPTSQPRCLCSTNIIASCFSEPRSRTTRVTNLQDGSMFLRSAASALLETGKNFRRIIGYQSLWTLRAHLERDETESLLQRRKVG